MAALVGTWTSAAGAATPLPETISYSFYVGGQPAGGTVIHVHSTASALIFDSNVHAVVGKNEIKLKCHTEADPKTYVLRTFSYTGTKGGGTLESSVHVDGDSVYGYLSAGKARVPRHVKLDTRNVLILEDWVMELQVLLARRQALETHSPTNYKAVFANAFIVTDVVAGYTGEALVETKAESIAARMLEVAVQGSAPFESQVDSDRGLPVYLRFPSVRTEVFLDSLFGKNPVTYFKNAPNDGWKPAPPQPAN